MLYHIGIDMNQHLLITVERIAFDREGIKPEVTVASACPTPIDVITAIIATVKDKSMSSLKVIIAREQNGMTLKDFLLDHGIPILTIVAGTLHHNRVAVAKRTHTRQLLGHIRPTAVGTVIHMA